MDWKYMDLRFLQSENAYHSIDSTDAGIVIDSKASHPSKVPSGMSFNDSERVIDFKWAFPVTMLFPIYTTELGMVNVVNPQFENAQAPIFVTEFGMSMEVRVVIPPKAYLAILLTVFGMTVFWHPWISSLVSVCIIALQLSPLLYVSLSLSTIMVLMPAQPLNGVLPMYDTFLGMVIDWSL